MSRLANRRVAYLLAVAFVLGIALAAVDASVVTSMVAVGVLALIGVPYALLGTRT